MKCMGNSDKWESGMGSSLGAGQGQLLQSVHVGGELQCRGSCWNWTMMLTAPVLRELQAESEMT